MHAEVYWNDDVSTLEVTLATSMVVEIFNALSEATGGLSAKELDGLRGKGDLSLDFVNEEGGFTIHLPLPQNHQPPVPDKS